MTQPDAPISAPLMIQSAGGQLVTHPDWVRYFRALDLYIKYMKGLI